MKKTIISLLIASTFLLTGCDESNPAAKELHDYFTPESLANTFSGTLSSALDDTINNLSIFFGSDSPDQALDALEGQGNDYISNIEEILNEGNEKAKSTSGRPDNAISDKTSSFSDNTLNRPDSGSNGAVSDPTETPTLIPSTLIRVVDGDTLIVQAGDDEVRVRLIGIDTPESVNSAYPEKNNEWGIMASNHTKELLKDYQQLYLEYDQELTDRYGRTLAYVWMNNDTSDMLNMLNYRILNDGYCNTMFIDPNTKYKQAFESCKENVESNQTGLWSDQGFCSLWE